MITLGDMYGRSGVDGRVLRLYLKIALEGSIAVVSAVTIRDCTANVGGGGLVSGASVTGALGSALIVEDCVAQESGGGIAMEGAAVLAGASIRGCTAPEPTAADIAIFDD